ncbi:GH92 family glycosyl hydrolase [Chitinophaga sedimenti]|uniref:GH92 family glycosyl hydrolase n=1 Tax=Chitinophaga sedimenti TaxID=2033606 RepID=UPI002004B06D|nr:GH92 family glycosyl hydrolase [Chitinophaga sedimenti]MCK7556806.1 GH92 family glycosyl hydrolase [Chitinophaga sedimenti]
MLLAATSRVSAQQQEELAGYVDPLIGTAHCRWFHFAPGAYPFGMAKPGPSTNGHYGNPNGWEAVGYDYRHTSIEGFPNFHEFQVGGVSLMPTKGTLVTVPGVLEDSMSGYRSAFDRADEHATAGYYSVLLKRYGIKAEVTATPRVAFQRFTFPAGTDSHILFDIGNKQGESGEVKDAQVYMTPDGRIEGYVITLPSYVQKYQRGAEVAMYFSAVTDKKPAAYGTFRGAAQTAGARDIKGQGAGMYLTFSTTNNEAVTVKLGLSYTSIENARKNMQAEAASLSFEQARTQSRQQWNDYLGRINATGGTKADLTKFYTGLYHAVLGRGLASDVNGAYPKNTGGAGQIPLNADGKPKHNHYNTDAVWGAYWNLTPLWALAYPEYYSDFVSSQLLVYNDAGWLGDGIASSKYVSGVGTNFVGLVMAGAYNYGIRDFDVANAYAASLKNEIGFENRPDGAGKEDVERFRKYGYVDHIDPKAGEWCFSGSHTLEYSFSAYAVAQWAKKLGKKNDYNTLLKMSGSWKNIFDNNSKYMRPRYANGKFVDNFNPTEPWRGFQEGNAGQYSFYVPHDPQGLIAKMGKAEFNKRLDSIFTAAQKTIFGGGNTIDAFAGLAAPYNHGNQPCLQMPRMFNYSGKPHLTQKWVRAICNEFYGTEGVHGYGYGQDEDQGQLGAWYVLSAIGLFDVQGGAAAQPEMQIGSSIFDKVTIKLNKKYYKGDQVEIVTRNNSATNIYLHRPAFNGKKLQRNAIPFSELTKGGKLEYDLSDQPAAF